MFPWSDGRPFNWEEDSIAGNLFGANGKMFYSFTSIRGGVKKGAFDEATAEAKFSAWKNDKQKGLEAFSAKLTAEKKAANEARLAEEKKTNEEIAKKVAEKKAAEAAAKAEAEAAAKAEAAEGETETPAEA